MNKRMNKWALVSIILAVLLLGCLVYFGVNRYKEARESEKNEIFLQGAQYGYQSAVTQIIQSGVNCKPVDVYTENESMQLVDVTCLS